MAFQDVKVIVQDRDGTPLIAFVDIRVFSFPVEYHGSGNTINGSITFRNLPADQGVIEVVKRGYRHQRKDIKVGITGVQEILFRLLENDDPDADPDETDDSVIEKINWWLKANTGKIILVLMFIVFLGIMALLYIKGYWKIGMFISGLKGAV